MRAKRVNENIKFQRGTDPKETLELGEHRPEKLMEKIIKMGPAIAAQTDMGWAVTQNRYGSGIEWNYQFLNALIPEGIRALYHQMMDVLKQNESLDFERGKDPKESLKIGLGQYSLSNKEFRDKLDKEIYDAISEDMELPKEKIFFMGDTRDSKNAEYLDSLSTVIYNSPKIRERELTSSDELLQMDVPLYIGIIEVYDTEAGKIASFEGNDHAEFYGDINAFNTMNTRNYI